MYRLKTLGHIGLTVGDGSPLDFPLGKPFGMLVYLALAERPVPRDELAAVFWPDSDRSRARQSVRQALSFIRKWLGEDVLPGDDPVRVDRSRLATDVAELEQRLAPGSEEAVAGLYGGPFLGAFQLTASTEWDHWVESRRHVLAERVGALFREASRQADDAESAVAWARRAVHAEPQRTAHRVALLERLLEQGDLDSALAELAEARQAELDEPEALEAVEQRIRSLRERRVDPDGVGLRFEFVGRSAELAALAARWRMAVAGHRQIAVLHGPTGIGKTRLAEELCALAVTSGAETIHVKASRSERRLEWSMAAELARALYAFPGAAGISGGSEQVLRMIMPSLPGDGPGRAEGRDLEPVALSDALVDLVSAVAYEGPLLIVLDDTQWVDRSSVAVLLRMARHLRDEPVLLVFTFRSEEVSDRGYATTEALVREEGALTLRLAPLTESDVEEFLALSGIEEDAAELRRFARRLHAVSQGHPLFLVELTHSLVDDGTLVREGDAWRFRGPPPQELELPASVQQVIARRLDRLGDEAKRLATAVAQLPPHAGLARARVRSGLTESQAALALNELLQRDVLRWDARGALSFAHDQLRDAMGKRRHGRRFAAVPAALLLLLLVVAALSRTVGGSTDLRYGGGTLVFLTADSIVAVHVRGANPSTWNIDAPRFWFPHDPHRYTIPRARRVTDGRLVWFGGIQDPVNAPDAVVYPAPGQRRVVVDRPGDDLVWDISPDGRRFLVATEDLSTPQYDVQLEILGPGPSDDRVLATGASSVRARWSADGTRIAARLSRKRDIVVVYSPRGDTLFSRDYFWANFYGWCGPEKVMLAVRDRPTDLRRRVLLDVINGSELVLDTAVLNMDAVCSPDGSAYIDGRLVGGHFVRYLNVIGRDEHYPLPQWVSGPVSVQWIPDRAEPVPVGLDVRTDSMVLQWGARQDLPTGVRMSDGSIRPGDIRWRSAEPSVASVLGDGRLSANRPGTTQVIADFRHWLADTVLVRVTGNGESTPHIAEDFRTLDPERWIRVGLPNVTPTVQDGRAALQLVGDGRYMDGIIARKPWVSKRGMTVEFELRMPLTSRERQSFDFGLVAAEPPADTEAAHTYSQWSVDYDLHLGYPAYKLQKWSDRTLRFFSRAGEDRVVEIPADVDFSQWVHVAIQVRADGMASLWLDRRKVAEIPMPLDFLDRPLRPVILAGTVGTEGFIRDFAWWTEARYR